MTGNSRSAANVKQRSFAHSVTWNLAGTGIPLAFAFFAIPILLSGYGNARFGFLTIVWSLIGYFSIFDLGIGRALTKTISERLGGGKKDDIADINHTALSVMFLLGIFACGLLEILAPVLARFLKLDVDLYHESVISLRLLALGLPFVIVSAGLIGVLEAHAQFRAINIIRLVIGLLNFGAPLFILHWSSSLIPATVVLVFSRVLTYGLYFFATKRLAKDSFSKGRFRHAHLKELVSFGSWITVSNVIGPLMTQLDKVVVGGVIALSLLPFYSIPGDLVNRLSFAPVAMISVFFPTFAAKWGAGDRAGISSLYGDANKVMFAALFPIALCMYAFAPEGLTLWLGQAFSQQSTPLLRWLCIGLLINAVSRIPHALLQAVGRPDITAKIHILEFPIYGIGLWFLLAQYGILGAATAWTGRILLDFLLLVFCANVIVPETNRKSMVMIGAGLICVAAMLCTAALHALLPKTVICVIVLIVSISYALRVLFQIRHHD